MTPVRAPLALRRVCGWCPTVLAVGDPGAAVSHGLCKSCAAKLDREMDALFAADGVAV